MKNGKMEVLKINFITSPIGAQKYRMTTKAILFIVQYIRASMEY